MPSTIKLGKLHQVIQIAMGWHDGHLHCFEIDGTTFSCPLPDTDWENTNDTDYRRVTLVQVISTVKTKFNYMYDFGDGWDHKIIVEKIVEAEQGFPCPVCLAGERACPPEDVGGIWGYADFLKAIRNPKNKNHAHLLEWIGGSFDSEAFNLTAVNQALFAMRS